MVVAIQANVNVEKDQRSTAEPANLAMRKPPIPTGLMLAYRTGQLRLHAREVAEEADAVNHDAMRIVLQEQIELHLRLSVPQVLELLSTEFGMSWSDIGRVVGVTVQSLRKWRQGQPAVAEHRMRLAQLAAFLSVLSAQHIADPASWLELPILDRFRPRRIDLLRAGRGDALFDLAMGHARPEQALEVLSPDWRESLASEHEVFKADDGMLSLRRRR